MPTIEPRKDKNQKIIGYRAKVRVKGYPPVSATFKKKTDADHWAQRIEAQMREDKYFPSNKAKKHNVSDLIDAYLADLRVKNPRRHDEVHTMLTWWKEELGHNILLHFKSHDIIKGQQKLMSRQTSREDANGNRLMLSPATVNRYTAALHTAMRFGIRPLKWISTNPVDDIDKLKESIGRTRYLSEDEMKRLLDACQRSKNTHLYAVVILGIATGARRKEIQYIKWTDVNAAATRVTLRKTKNGEVRAIFLTGAAAKIVQKMRDKRPPDEVYVFSSPNIPSQPINFESSWQYALKTAGIMDFRFHDLRHTCGSYLAMNGASAVEIAEVLGHKTLQMARRYAHLSDTHTSTVISKMTERVLGHVEI